MPAGLNAGSAYVSIHVDTSSFTRDVKGSIKPTLDAAEKSANGTMSGVASAAANITKVGALAAGAAALGAIGAIGKMGMEYQNSLNVFQAVSGATAAQMDKVKVAARDLGNDITLPGISAKDAAAAMTELAKGGLSVAQSMDAAKGTLQLAKAAEIDGAQAAEIQANALAMFGLKADQAGHVADVLANAANASSSEITDLAYSMKYVGPVAKALSVGIDDAATAMGMLANSGIKGEQAGTTLRGMFASLVRPSKDSAKAIKAMGIDAFDASGKFIGMKKFLEQLTIAQHEMTQEQFAGNVANAFGRETMSGVIALASQGPAAFDAMSKAVSRQGGAAEVAAAKSKGLAGAIDAMKSTLETAGLVIYDKVAPAVEKGIRGITDAMPGVLDTVGSFVMNIVDGFTSLATSPVVKDIGNTVTTMADNFTKAFSSIVDSKTFTSIVDSIQRIADVVQGPLQTGWTTIKPVLETAATVLGTTLGGAVDGIKKGLDGLASTLEFVNRNFGTIKATVEGLATTLAVVFLPQLAAAAVSLYSTGTAAVVSAGETAILWTMYKVDAVMAIGSTIASNARLLASYVATGAAAVASAAETAILWTMYKVEALSSLGGAIAAMGRMALSYAATALAAVRSAAQTAILWTMYKVESVQAAGAMVASGAQVIASWVARGAAAAASAARTVAAFVVEKAQSAAAVAAFLASNVVLVAAWAARTAGTIASTVASGIAATATLAMAAAQWVLNSSLFACPLTWIVLAIMALVAAVIIAWRNSQTFRDVVMAAWNGIKAAVAAVLDWFTGVLWPGLKAVWDGVVAALQMVWSYAGVFVKAYIGIYVFLFKTLFAIVVAIKNAVVAAFTWIWTVVVPAVANGVRSIISFFTGLWTQYVIIVGAIKTAVVNAFVGLWNTVVNTVRDGIRRALSLVQGLKTSIVGVFSGAASWLVNAGKDIINGIVSGLDAAKNWIKDKIEALKKLIPDWALKAIGANSPAKIMLGAGRALSEGMAAGIDQSSHLVGKAVGRLADSARVAVSPVTLPVVARAGIRPRTATGPLRQLQDAAAGYQAAPAVQVTVNGALDANAVGRQVVDLLKRESRFRVAPVIAQ